VLRLILAGFAGAAMVGALVLVVWMARAPVPYHPIPPEEWDRHGPM